MQNSTGLFTRNSKTYENLGIARIKITFEKPFVEVFLTNSYFNSSRTFRASTERSLAGTHVAALNVVGYLVSPIMMLAKTSSSF